METPKPDLEAVYVLIVLLVISGGVLVAIMISCICQLKSGVLNVSIGSYLQVLCDETSPCYQQAEFRQKNGKNDKWNKNGWTILKLSKKINHGLPRNTDDFDTYV